MPSIDSEFNSPRTGADLSNGQPNPSEEGRSQHHLLSLSEIYTGRLFRIPDYQRGYSWETRQLQEFWDDLIHLPTDHIHYMGVLTVERPSRERCLGWVRESAVFAEDAWVQDGHSAVLSIDGTRIYPFYVVDGQQRLLTITILLTALSESPLLSEDERKVLARQYLCLDTDGAPCHWFGYEVDLPSHLFLIRTILKNEPSPEAETAYTDNLLGAKRFFQRQLGNLDAAQHRSLVDKLTNSVQFNYYEIDARLDVFVVFETTNNRGKVLSCLELLKNRLLYLSTMLIGISPESRHDLRRQINDAWRTVYQWLAKNRDRKRPLADDAFLRAHWIMFFPYDDRKADFADDLLAKRFVPQLLQSGRLDEMDIRKYVRSLADSAKAWFQINFPQHAAADLPTCICEWMVRINEVRPESLFRPVLLALLQSRYDEFMRMTLMRAIERHEFLVFGLANAKATANRAHFWRQANAFLEEDLSLEEIKDEVRRKAERVYSQKKFKDHVDELFLQGSRDDRGYPEWPLIKYFLYEYEESLRAGREVLVAREDCCFERVYPRSTERGESWEVHYEGYTDDARSKLCNSLGNLVLLSKRRSGGDMRFDSFAEKKRHVRVGSAFEEVGYSLGSYSEQEVAQNDVWRHEEIMSRGLKLLEFMSVRWSIPLGEEFRKTITQVNFAFRSDMEHQIAPGRPQL